MKKTNNQKLLLACIFVAVLFCLLFNKFLFGSAVLMATDPVVSASNKSASEVLSETVANWDSGVLLGGARGSATQIAGLLQGVLSGVLWNNVIYGLACLAASFVFLIGFGNGKKLNLWAVLCGVLAAFWLGSNFTLIYAGHGQKPYVVLFFVCSVLSAGVPSWRGGLLWGGFFGLMFAQQPDVAMFFAFFAGAHLIFSLWRREGFKPFKWLKVLAPAAVIAFLFASGPLLSGYKLNVKDTVQAQTETPQAKWDYITQWSFPPDEVISLIAPGYHGWRSGEPAGPYWGRTGQSAGWDQTHQGYMNFMMESAYIGFIPVAFALFALFSCRRSPHRAEIIFWGGAAGIALLLAFGKYTPLYSLFYHLPVVNNIRNPNKFLQIFQVALAILTVYGADRLLSGEWRVARGQTLKSKVESRKSTNADLRLPSSVLCPPFSALCPPSSVLRTFFWFTAVVLGVLVVCALSASINRSAGIADFTAQGWPADAARVIVSNQVKALWHTCFMAAIVAMVFAVFTFPRLGKALRCQRWIAAGLVLLIFVDVLALSKHYVKEMPRSFIQANALTGFLEKDLGIQRVALLSQQGIYGLWATYLLPYNRIPTFNFSDMPRMAKDYQVFLAAGYRDPLNMWRFSSVKYLLAPSAVEKKLLAANCRKVFAYNVFQTLDGGYGIVPDMNGSYAVFELLGTLPRYALFAGSRKGSDELALNRLADFSSVTIPLESSLPELNGSGQTGEVDILTYRPGKVRLRVRTGVPAILRCSEKYDVDWKASIDGTPVVVERVDYLCQGVAIFSGEHTVELRYAPSRLFFYMQCAGCLILFAVPLSLFFRRKDGYVAN